MICTPKVCLTFGVHIRIAFRLFCRFTILWIKYLFSRQQIFLKHLTFFFKYCKIELIEKIISRILRKNPLK